MLFSTCACRRAGPGPLSYAILHHEPSKHQSLRTTASRRFVTGAALSRRTCLERAATEAAPTPGYLHGQILHLYHRPLAARLSTLLTREPSRSQPSHPVTSKPYPPNTEKLELPSISQVHSRGPVDASWYNTQFTPRPTVSSERLPALPQIQSGANTSSNNSSPRGGSISSASAINSSASSHTSYSSSVNGSHSGFKTPSPEQTPQTLGRDPHSLNGQSQDSPYAQQHQPSGYGYATDSYANMNQMQSYADVQQHHLPNAGHATSSGPPSTMGHYAYNQQPPYLQPGPTNSIVQGSYYQNSYGNGMPPTPSTATMNSSLVPASLPLPGKDALFLNYPVSLRLTWNSDVRWWSWLICPWTAGISAYSPV